MYSNLVKCIKKNIFNSINIIDSKEMDQLYEELAKKVYKKFKKIQCMYDIIDIIIDISPLPDYLINSDISDDLHDDEDIRNEFRNAFEKDVELNGDDFKLPFSELKFTEETCDKCGDEHDDDEKCED